MRSWAPRRVAPPRRDGCRARRGDSAGRRPKRPDFAESPKELTEATLRAALDQLEEPYEARDDLPVLMKRWRKAIEGRATPDPEGEATLDKAQAAFGSLVTFLAEWRNVYGRGHGRPRYRSGLAARHARLAADVAETCVRFIVTTMDDLERLPPRREQGPPGAR
jgi:hypothetical protein